MSGPVDNVGPPFQEQEYYDKPPYAGDGSHMAPRGGPMPPQPMGPPMMQGGREPFRRFQSSYPPAQEVDEWPSPHPSRGGYNAASPLARPTRDFYDDMRQPQYMNDGNKPPYAGDIPHMAPQGGPMPPRPMGPPMMQGGRERPRRSQSSYPPAQEMDEWPSPCPSPRRGGYNAAAPHARPGMHSKIEFLAEPGAPGRTNKWNVTSIGSEPPQAGSFSNAYEGRHFEGPLKSEHSSFDRPFGFRAKDRMKPYPLPFQRSKMSPMTSDPYTRPQPPMGMQDDRYKRRSPPLLSMSCKGGGPQRKEYGPPQGGAFSNSYSKQCFEGPPITRDSSYNHPFGFRDEDSNRPYFPPMGSDPNARPQLPMSMQNDLYERRSPPLSCVKMTTKETHVDEVVPIEEENEAKSCTKEIQKLNTQLKKAEIEIVSYKNKIEQLKSKCEAVEKKCSQIEAENVALKDEIYISGTDLAFELDGLVVVAEVSGAKDNLPPRGELIQKKLNPDTQVWTMNRNFYKSFVLGKVMLVSDEFYEVKVEGEVVPKLFSAKQLAYTDISLVLIPVGTRILAGLNCMFAGVVAEIPKTTNKQRYLIFFDDGSAKYFQHKDLRLFCSQSQNVANDMSLKVQPFVQAYLAKYPEWPLLKLKVNEEIRPEYNFQWLDAKVLKIDSSMAQIQFLETSLKQWVYRGATRFKSPQSTVQKSTSKPRICTPGSA